MACSGCRQTRAKLADEVRRGDLAAAVKTATKGATDMAAHALKRISRPPPRIVRTFRRR